MSRSIGVFCVLLLAVCGSASAAESRSDEFIKQAIEGNLFEVKAGELAQAKGASESVRQFGAMLAKDHAQARATSVQAAKSIGAKAPTSPSATQREMLDALSKLEGDRFDEHFITSMIDDHLRDVARYESHAKGESDAVSQYAAQTLPTLRDHLKAVQALRNERATQ